VTHQVRRCARAPHLHQDDVELVQEHALAPEGRLVRGQLDDQVADVVADALALLVRQRAPAELYHLLQDLRAPARAGR
jgi:hypothetical protein